ncbi:hypothetical protein TWF481_002366 [Arthrobotrys musiformis]|uniref:UBX domain-containing protein n=1 Tax=Arthrobotrys musiformis TaxID=47236 RepID=A0AAV9VVD6_9PEZI
MSDSIFFSGRIEEAIQATVANQKPLACFVTDESDDSNLWENDYLSHDAVSTSLRTSAITVRLLKDSTEANYLNAFCSITTYPTLLIIKNGGAGVDGLTVIVNPISKDEFIAKISSTFGNLAAPANLLDGVNSSPSFPNPAPTSTTQTTTTTSPPHEPTPTPSTSADTLPANTQFPPESDTGRRLASIQAQHRERIARLKAQREAAELEAQKKRELARREDTQAMASAAEAQKSRSNKQYADEQKKKKIEAEKERRRVLDQIKADREEMKIREANRKAIAAEAEAPAQSIISEGKGKEVPRDGQCNLAFRLFDGSRISYRFPADATIEGDVRPWLDSNRTDSNQPYKLVVQSSSMSSKTIDGTSSLSDLGLYPSAILILKPIASSKVSTAFAPARRTGANNNQQNFIVSFFLSIWLMVLTFLGLHDPSASVVVGEKKDSKKKKEKSGNSAGSEDEDIATASSASVSTPVVSRDVAKKRIRTLHDGDGDKRSAYYNGNQLDFEPKKKKEGEEE